MRRFNISTNLDNCFHLQLKCKMQIQIREKLTNADANGARLAVKNFCAQTEIKTFPWRPRWAWPGGRGRAADNCRHLSQPTSISRSLLVVPFCEN